MDGAARTVSATRAFTQAQSAAQISTSAAATAFWTLIALGPAGLVAINLLGLFVDQEVIANRLSVIAGEAPGSFGDLLVEQFAEVARPSPGSFVMDVVLLVLALWTVSAAVASLIRGIRRVYGLAAPGFAITRLLAAVLGFVLILGIGMIAIVIDPSSTLWRFVGLIVGLAAVCVLVGLIYRSAMPSEATWRECVPGMLLSAVSLAAINAGWERLASISPQSSVGSHAVASIVVSMLAIWLAVWAVLAGAVVNKLRTPRALGELHSVTP